MPIRDIKIVQSQYSQYSRRYDTFREGKILPVFDPQKAGGALMDLNLYNLYFVMGLFGRPDGAKYYANIERAIDTSGTLFLQYPTFYAMCTAAKDCKGNYGGVIRGTKGCIRNIYPPNLIGEVSLELNDGTVEKYDDRFGKERLSPEFTAFVKAINEKDYVFCSEQLSAAWQSARFRQMPD